MPVCFFNSPTNGEHSNLLIVATSFNSSFSCKTSSPFRNSHLLIFLDDKAEVLPVCLYKLYRVFFAYFSIDCVNFLTNSFL